VSPAVRAAVGIPIAAALLLLAFRRTDWAEVRAAFERIDPLWVIIAHASGWLSCLLRTARWGRVVRPVFPATFGVLLDAMHLGLLVNAAVPARLGEAVRAHTLARRAGQSFTTSLGTVALDRAWDSVAVLSMIAIALATLPSGDVRLAPGSIGNPSEVVVPGAALRWAAWTSGAGLLVGAVSLALLRARGDRLGGLLARAPGVGGLLARVRARFDRLVAAFSAGLGGLSSRSDSAWAAALTVATWALQAFGLGAFLVALGLEVPWSAPPTILAALALAISVPLTPGHVGQYHVMAVLATLIVVPGADAARAKAFAIVAHASAQVPVVILGLLGLIRSPGALLPTEDPRLT
jgi:glycosyltransferase 2 family protein